jgi:hypothetical protein
MLASALLYLGLSIAVAGFVVCVKPSRWLPIVTRGRGLALVAAGVAVAAVAFALPAAESRIDHASTRLDEFMPVWQFNEFHTIRVEAPPARVYDAIKRVRADEIRLFLTLTWIRRGGRPLPPGILNAGDQRSILDISTATSFVWLADDAPREMVVGTVVGAPPGTPSGTRAKPTPDLFRKTLPPGFALATMNFIVTPNGDGSIVSTETRVFTNSPEARRRFARYWRVIYPGSAIIRRMWLRAIERRATQPVVVPPTVARTGVKP